MRNCMCVNVYAQLHTYTIEFTCIMHVDTYVHVFTCIIGLRVNKYTPKDIHSYVGLYRRQSWGLELGRDPDFVMGDRGVFGSP